MQDNTFVANIVQTNGILVTLNDVVAVRVISRYYNLLIMKDYMPVIGEVDGALTVVSKTAKYEMPSGVAYFVNQNNEFTLIIKDDHGGTSKLTQGVEGVA